LGGRQVSLASLLGDIGESQLEVAVLFIVEKRGGLIDRDAPTGLGTDQVDYQGGFLNLLDQFLERLHAAMEEIILVSHLTLFSPLA
jgi:hypothetical protein